jgi:hypothetical protein
MKLEIYFLEYREVSIMIVLAFKPLDYIFLKEEKLF